MIQIKSQWAPWFSTHSLGSKRTKQCLENMWSKCLPQNSGKLLCLGSRFVAFVIFLKLMKLCNCNSFETLWGLEPRPLTDRLGFISLAPLGALYDAALKTVAAVWLLSIFGTLSKTWVLHTYWFCLVLVVSFGTFRFRSELVGPFWCWIFIYKGRERFKF